MKNKLLGGAGLVIFVCALWLGPLSKPGSAPTEVQEPITNAVVKKAAVEEKAMPEQMPAEVKKLEPQPEPFEFQQELETYSDITAKVFLSDEEKRSKKDLLSNSRFLTALGEKLNGATGPGKISDKAVDVLLEALESGDKDAANEALQSIVENSRVEDQTLDGSTRQYLAGVKAEVLHYWSSRDPQKAAQLQSWLPGPVSRRIWSNVTDLQKSNLAESRRGR